MPLAQTGPLVGTTSGSMLWLEALDGEDVLVYAAAVSAMVAIAAAAVAEDAGGENGEA